MKDVCTEVSCEFFQSYEWCKAPSCPYKKSVTMTADGYWYHGNGKIGGEFHPTKPNDEEHYGEYVKVKHGRWVEDEYGIPHCSECKAINNSVFKSYCPNCGARMDEKETDFYSISIENDGTYSAGDGDEIQEPEDKDC